MALFVIAELAWIISGACVLIFAFRKQWRTAALSAILCTAALLIASALAPHSDKPPIATTTTTPVAVVVAPRTPSPRPSPTPIAMMTYPPDVPDASTATAEPDGRTIGALGGRTWPCLATRQQYDVMVRAIKANDAEVYKYAVSEAVALSAGDKVKTIAIEPDMVVRLHVLTGVFKGYECWVAGDIPQLFAP